MQNIRKEVLILIMDVLSPTIHRRLLRLRRLIVCPDDKEIISLYSRNERFSALNQILAKGKIENAISSKGLAAITTPIRRLAGSVRAQ
jgi:hypothetical protein